MCFYVLPLLVTEDSLPMAGGSGSEPISQATGFIGSSVSELFVNSLSLGGQNFVVPAVLWFLLCMSAITWCIVFSKAREMFLATRQSDMFSEIFWNTKNFVRISAACESLKASPVASVYASGHAELMKIVETRDSRSVTHEEFGDLENIERAIKRAKAEELTRLERGTIFLATTASAAPFVGLFGTVWGIMRAFMGLSQATSTSIQAVAPGISEALIATAVGLAAAIPAAIAYNFFMQQVRYLSREMDKFSAEFLNIAKRHFL